MGVEPDRRLSGERKGFYERLRADLRAHAERSFALGVTDEKGISYRTILEGLIERTRNPEKRAGYEAELACPPLPPSLTFLWSIYRRLRRRKGGGFGLSPIEWPDIDAFLRHARLTLAPWEVDIIEMLDDLFLTANAPQKPKRDRSES